MQTAANDVFIFKNYPNNFPKEFIKKRMSGEIIGKYEIKDLKAFILYRHTFTFKSFNIYDFIKFIYFIISAKNIHILVNLKILQIYINQLFKSN